jgi:hypothetical protein
LEGGEKKLRRLYAGAVVISFLAALLIAPMAQADEKQVASGTVYPVGPPSYYEESIVGDNLIITAGWPFAQTGTFSGSVFVEQMIVVELDTGKMEGYDITTFMGTIAGETGSYQGVHEWTAVGGFAVGTWEIISGTVGSANLEGEGTFVTDMETGLGTYLGYIELNN